MLSAWLDLRLRIKIPHEGNVFKCDFAPVPVLGGLLCAISEAPPGACRNRYKFLMAKIERLCFSSGQEWRKFLQNMEGLEWQQIGGAASFKKALNRCFRIFDF
jgi:hypothetical protein